MLGAVLNLDRFDREVIYLPVTGIRYLLKEWDYLEKTGHKKFEVYEG